jgi:DNA invertase Pin-like site-specific DNA recombinase
MSIRVIGYVRVSTDEQHTSGAGLAAQKAAIIAECERRGYELVRIIGEDAGASGKTLERKGLQDAMAILDAKKADVLMVSKVDRLSRKLDHGAQVMDRAQRKGWSLVCLDMGIDMTSPSGAFMGHMLLAGAQYERSLIGQRTKAALAVKREQGVRLGRPQTLPDDVVERIARARADGLSFPAIAQQLNDDGVPTARGKGAWRWESVRKVCQSQAAVHLHAS